MDLVYTVYKYGGGGPRRPPPSADASVCTISSQVVILSMYGKPPYFSPPGPSSSFALKGGCTTFEAEHISCNLLYIGKI